MPPPKSTLFPYTTLFRSGHSGGAGAMIKTVGIVGAGQMGNGIAPVFALAGKNRERTSLKSHHHAPPEIYTLPLHDALPIWPFGRGRGYDQNCWHRWGGSDGERDCPCVCAGGI